MGLMILIVMIVVAVLLLAWTTRSAARGRSPGIRWQGIDWRKGSEPAEDPPQDPH